MLLFITVCYFGFRGGLLFDAVGKAVRGRIVGLWAVLPRYNRYLYVVSWPGIASGVPWQLMRSVLELLARCLRCGGTGWHWQWQRRCTWHVMDVVFFTLT
jgi:hypothetical protein